MQIGLHFGSRQPGLDEKPPEPSLHRRFSGSRKAREETKPTGACATTRCLRVTAERARICEARTECHVDRDQGIDCWVPKAQIGESPEQVWRAQFSDGDNLVGRNLAATHSEPLARAHM